MGSRIKMIDAAVLEYNDLDQELLLSLSLLIQLDILPPDFLNRSITDYFNKLLSNKQITTTYSSLYTEQTKAFDEDEKAKHKLPEPSKKCKDLREKILGKHPCLFKEKLEKSDRIKGPPIRLTIDPSKNIRPMNHVRPYDVPYNLRATRHFLRLTVQQS